MKDQVAITIGMPVFNDKDFIEDSINSLLNQSFKNFIFLISDDGSTDGSAEVCKKYAQKDNRIKYIRQEQNLGISRNMQFLFSLCKTDFFMWAGDDDLYDPNFIQYHLEALKNKPEAVSAFGDCVLINEMSEEISNPVINNYSNPDRLKRLKNYIKNSTDYFGYGVFRAESIKGVEFPVWWWPNKKTPYNNIYPTLCYYLSKGDFAYVDKGVLFYKRVKSHENTNHVLTGKNNAVKESLSFWIRKINLVFFTSTQIKKSTNFFVIGRILPYLIYFWFWKPSLMQFRLASRSFLKNKLKIGA